MIYKFLNKRKGSETTSKKRLNLNKNLDTELHTPMIKKSKKYKCLQI